MIMANEKKKKQENRKKERKKKQTRNKPEQGKKEGESKKESKKEIRKKDAKTEWKSVSQNNNKKQKESLTVFKSCATLPIICLISNACILSIAFS
jgi:Flp pilus assembly protein TadB